MFPSGFPNFVEVLFLNNILYKLEINVNVLLSVIDQSYKRHLFDILQQNGERHLLNKLISLMIASRTGRRLLVTSGWFPELDVVAPILLVLGEGSYSRHSSRNLRVLLGLLVTSRSDLGNQRNFAL